MPIPIVVEDQNQLPEGLEDHYKAQDDGRYLLDVEGVDSHPDVSGLKTAYQKEKEKRQQVAKQRDEFKQRADLIPEDMDTESLQQAIEKAKNGGKDPEIEKLKAKWQEELDKRDSAIESKDKQMRNLIIENNLSAALTENAVTNPTFQKAAKRLLADQIELEEDHNGNLNPVVENNLGKKLPLNEFVKNWTSGDEGKAFVDESRGSGARGAGGGPKGKKEMTREQFDQLPENEKIEFSKNGGKLTD